MISIPKFLIGSTEAFNPNPEEKLRTMKNLYPGLIAILFLSLSLDLSAQESAIKQEVIPDKPLVFSKFPSKTESRFTDLKKIFSYKVADKISIPFGSTSFTGEVVEKIQRQGGVTSMNIRSINFPESLLNITITTESDNTQTINGRIINLKSGDVLVITQENGRYIIRKESLKLYMPECSL
jgi:hypothetical protein